MTAPTLTEAAAEYAAERTAVEAEALRIRRDFLAGALAAATDKRPREHVLAELVQYGRTIGSAVERAV